MKITSFVVNECRFKGVKRSAYCKKEHICDIKCAYEKVIEELVSLKEPVYWNILKKYGVELVKTSYNHIGLCNGMVLMWCKTFPTPEFTNIKQIIHFHRYQYNPNLKKFRKFECITDLINFMLGSQSEDVIYRISIFIYHYTPRLVTKKKWVSQRTQGHSLAIAKYDNFVHFYDPNEGWFRTNNITKMKNFLVHFFKLYYPYYNVAAREKFLPFVNIP